MTTVRMQRYYKGDETVKDIESGAGISIVEHKDKIIISANGTLNPGIYAVVDDPNPQLGNNLDAQNFKIENLGAPAIGTDAANKSYVDTKAAAEAAAAVSGKIGALVEDLHPTLAANLNANSNRIINLATPIVATDAATKAYVDTMAAAFGINSVEEDPTPKLGGQLDANNFKIVNLGNPVSPADVTHKNYVDTGLAGKANTVHTHVLADITDAGTMAAQNAANYTPTSGLAIVAISGNYNDLSNKPNLSPVALTGALDDLTDVVLVSPSVGQVLKYNGVVWSNGLLDYAQVANTPHIPTNSEFSFVGLNQTTDVVIPNGFLRWDNTGSNIIYLSSIGVSDITGLADIATSGDYADLSNTPAIPAVLNDLSDVTVASPAGGQTLVYNGSQWVNTDLNYSNLVGAPILATVATSGQYADLIGKPTLALVATTGQYADLIGKPTLGSMAAESTADYTPTVGLAPVAISNDYNDLANLPVIPTNNSFTFVGLSDTNNTVVNNGYLVWNSSGTEIEYSTTIPAGAITGLATVAMTGNYNDLINKPTLAQVASTADYGDLINVPFVPSTINDLADAALLSPTVGQYLRYNGSYWANNNLLWADVTGAPAIPTLLDNLSDVVITSPVVKNVLRYNGTNWVNAMIDYSDVANTPTLALVATSGNYNDLSNLPALSPVATGGMLNDLNDVVISTPASGQVVKYTGTQWVNAQLNYSDIGGTPVIPTMLDNLNDVTISGQTSGQSLVYNGSQWVNGSVNYNNLSNLPVLGTMAAEDAADYTPTAGLATVAISGSYMDLINKPFIPGTLNDLTDTVVISPAAGQTLRFDGSNWLNAQLNYADLAGTPVIPSNLDSLTDVIINLPASGQTLRFNGSTWVNQVLSYADLTGTPTLALVATSGNYNDLTNKPTIPVNNDFTFVGLSDTNDTPVINGFLRWNGTATEIEYNATISVTDITGLAQVATSGDYNDLGNLPTIPTNLDGLSDVIITTPASGQTLRYNGADWVNTQLNYTDLAGLPVIPTNLDNLTDVIVSAPTTAQVLRYNGSHWINQVLAYSDLTGTPVIPTNLDSLSDVTITTPTANQVIRFNGLDWENQILNYSDLAGTPTIPTNNDFTFVGLSDTNNTVVSNGFLRWDNTGSQINYSDTIDYADLINTPTIPVNNDFSLVGLNDTNDTVVVNGYLRWNNAGTQVDYSATIPATDITGLSPVATSGDYGDLVNVPFVPEAFTDLADVYINNPQIGETVRYSGTEFVNTKLDYTDLTGTPTLATVATTGNYADLSGTSNVITQDSPTGAITVPVGTTAQRPGSPVVGMIRFNTDTVTFEGWNGTTWTTLG